MSVIVCGARRREEFDDMLATIDIEEWLNYEGIDYRRTRGTRGAQLNLKTCPSCGKSVWKVYLNAETGLGNCFSGDCPQGTFNRYSFIREYLMSREDNPKVWDYIKRYVREIGWRPRQVISTAVEMTAENLVLPDYLPIPIDGKNLKYLANRRVDIEMAKYFNLGYIPSGYYKRRIFIPVHDLDGSLVSFQARDITDTAEKKYLFPQGFASTGKILYNGHNAWGRKHLVLVEGVFDAIGAKLALDEEKDLRKIGVVGSFGKNLSGDISGGESDQLSRFVELKQKGLKTVTILWDGEVKAIQSAVKAGQVLKGIGLEVRVGILPEDKDPSNVAPAVFRDKFRKALTLNQGNAIKLNLFTY